MGSEAAAIFASSTGFIGGLVVFCCSVVAVGLLYVVVSMIMSDDGDLYETED